MNKQNIDKLALFLTGIEQRISENMDFFKKITIEFKSGTKSYNANVSAQNEKLLLKFNGVSDILEITWLSARVSKLAVNYDSVLVIYEERGTTIYIEGDNKNVKMRTREMEKENIVVPHVETPQTGNREYYIKLGQADELLKEIGILSNDGKVKNDMVRKYSQIDHFIELIHDLLVEISSKHESITVLDCACGKSYLSFVLNYYIKEVMKKPCHFIGLDYSDTVIEASKRMAKNLEYHNMEFKVTDIRNYNTKRDIHLVISLHACDTATDEAIALAVNNNVDSMVMVPCCHRELLQQLDYKPLEPIFKYGILKARISDALTDGLRSMYLEALGYKVTVVEYISPLETPKNLMIRAIKSGNMDKKVMQEYKKLTSALNVSPSIDKLIVKNHEIC